MKNNYKWLLDAGHGGIDENGNYTTAPRKMYAHEGFTIYEGVINRAIVNKIVDKLAASGLDFALLHDEVVDTSLTERVRRANNIHVKNGNCILLSVHSNAGAGKGLEVFTSIGRTASDTIAQLLAEQYKKDFPEFPFRSDLADGDLDKEESFYMLSKPICPAVLVENFFFDNLEEAKLLIKDEFQERIASTLFSWIQYVEQLKPI